MDRHRSLSLPKIRSGAYWWCSLVRTGICGDAAKALDRPFERAIFIQSQMRTRLIVLHDIGGKNSPQVCLTEDAI
jgi:hypothetical protein